MNQHNLKNLVTGDPTFFDSFAFIFHRLPSCRGTLQLSSFTCCYTSGFLSMFFRAYQASFPRNVSFAAFLSLHAQDVFYEQNPWVFVCSGCNKVTQISSTRFSALMSHFVFYHTTTNILISSVYFCFHGEENITVFSCGLPALNGINYRLTF